MSGFHGFCYLALVNSVLNLPDQKGNLKRAVINATGQELFGVS